MPTEDLVIAPVETLVATDPEYQAALPGKDPEPPEPASTQKNQLIR